MPDDEEATGDDPEREWSLRRQRKGLFFQGRTGSAFGGVARWTGVSDQRVDPRIGGN